jgi:S-adenosylmethionine hydrolase
MIYGFVKANNEFGVGLLFVVFFKTSTMKVVDVVHSKQTVNLFHGKLVVKKKDENWHPNLSVLYGAIPTKRKTSVIRIISQSL